MKERVRRFPSFVVAAVLAASASTTAQAQPTTLTVTPAYDPANVMTVTEGASVTFTFTLDAPVTADRTLNFSLLVTEDGTIFKAASHFLNAAGLTFETIPGQMQNSATLTRGRREYVLTIPTVDDNVSEGPELIGVSGASVNTVLQEIPALICVLDDDGGTQTCPSLNLGPPPLDNSVVTIALLQTGGWVSEAGGATFLLTRTAPGNLPELPVDVQVSATPRERVVSSDLGRRTVTFSAGRLRAELDVRAVNDQVATPDGRVTATVLSGPGYEVGSPSSAQIEIRDDDGDAPPDDGSGGGDDDDGGGDDDDGDDGGGDDGGGDGGGDGGVNFELDGAECGPELCVTRVGVRLTAEDKTRDVVERLWTTSDGQTGFRYRFRPVWPEPGCYTLSLEVKRANSEEKETTSRQVHVRPSDGRDDGACDDGDGAPSGADFLLLGADCQSGLCLVREGVLSAEDTTGGEVVERLWTTSDGQTSSSRTFRPDWSSPGYYVLTLRVTKADGSTGMKSQRMFLRPGEPKGNCRPGARNHCFLDERYLVEVEFTTPDRGTTAARNVYEGTNETGLFWFVDKANWEMIVKVIDGCDVNGHHWVYGASATDVGFVIKVTDTKSDAVREYRNEAGNAARAVTDAVAFSGACEP